MNNLDKTSFLKVAIVGNPNSGKTTLFNNLTKSCSQVGNWAGVTVSKAVGVFEYQQQHIHVTDLPGCYSIIATEDTAADERITCQYLIDNPYDLIINIIDPANLQRELYLTLQLLELERPMMVIINQHKKLSDKQNIDVLKLQEIIKRPVISFDLNDPLSSTKIQNLICNLQSETSQPSHLHNLDKELISKINLLLASKCSLIKNTSKGIYLHALEGCKLSQETINQQFNSAAQYDIKAAITRNQQIMYILDSVVVDTESVVTQVPSKLDKIILNRVLGIPIFFIMMYIMFTFTINFGGSFQDFFDLSTKAIFVDGLRHILEIMHVPYCIQLILSEGIGRGINITASFIPVIFCLFFFLSIMENSGYLARAAFVVDRVMQILGLPGKSFVPMIVGFGCNVPAVLASRTLESKKDRILTIMMTPFMSCSARLAIYAVFVAAFFPSNGHNVIFSLYTIGVIAALITGLILRLTMLKGSYSPLIMELPKYQIPSLKIVYNQAKYKLNKFLNKAVKIIIPFCIVISIFNNYYTNSYKNLELMTQKITPIFEPMGLTASNWPATVSLFGGLIAKEVVIGTMTALYLQEQHSHAEEFSTQQLSAAIQSIPTNLKQSIFSIAQPWHSFSGATSNADNQIIGNLATNFVSPEAATAYLLFVLIYFPCVSVIAAIAKELNKSWAIFSISWTSYLAYLVAVIYYQCSTIAYHPEQSIAWVVGLLISFISVIFLLNIFSSANKSSGVSINKDKQGYRLVPTPIQIV